MGFACLVLVIVGMIGSIMDKGNIPKTVLMHQDDLCFREWRDLEEFNKQFMQAADRITGGKGLLAMSDVEATEAGKQLTQENQTLKTEFAAADRLWDVPVGTEITILKFYDSKGNDITPVWNVDQKTFYTPDGNAVYIAGEWNGKSIYTILTGK